MKDWLLEPEPHKLVLKDVPRLEIDLEQSFHRRLWHRLFNSGRRVKLATRLEVRVEDDDGDVTTFVFPASRT